MTPYERAQNERGTVEWKDGHNPKVVAYFKDCGHSWVKDDETAWCAAFVGAMLERSGISSTRKLNARSYLKWGEAVNLKDAKPGDIVVFSRGNPNGWQGHVGFFVRYELGYITCLSGNQSNQVCMMEYAKKRLLSIRRVDGLHAQKMPAKSGNPSAGMLAVIKRWFMRHRG